MVAARTAVRVGFEEVSILYRRTEKELPARLEETDTLKKKELSSNSYTHLLKF